MIFTAAYFAIIMSAQSSLFALKLNLSSIDGAMIAIDTYRDKVLLIVNTASECGYTAQYEQLQAIYSKYKERGFLVLGFPSNDFGAQEPASNKDIQSFCKVRFGVDFPLFAKGPVKGPQKQELFKFLTESQGASKAGEIAWNFEKFIVNRKGELVGRFSSATKPDHPDVLKLIEASLGAAK